MRLWWTRRTRPCRVDSNDREDTHDRSEKWPTAHYHDGNDRTGGRPRRTPYANAFPTAEPKTLRLTLSAGERAETHDHPDRYVILYLISGNLSLQLDDESYQLESGDLVHFDGMHAITSSADTDSTALLVLSKKNE